MTRRILLSCVAVLLLVSTAGCVTAPIKYVSNEPLGATGTLEEVTVWIERAARMQGWQTEPLQPNALLATKTAGRHVATSTIYYDTSTFSIQLRSSVDLRERGGQIHVRYNEWVDSLAATIRREVSLAPPR